MSDEDTFNKLKYQRYKLTVELLPDDDGQIDEIIEGLRTTIDQEPDFDESGDFYYSGLTIDELSAEAFCLGNCYTEIENKLNMKHPFEYYVETEW